MSYNGSGTFNINSTGQPVVTGTVISSTAFNALTADLATGLSTAITKDGQTTPTANIPMGGFTITGLGSGNAGTDAANLSQVQSAVGTFLTVSGTNTITASVSPSLTAYSAGAMFGFIAANTNTGATTINISALGAKSIVTPLGALNAGDLQSGYFYIIYYDGTNFQLLGVSTALTSLTVSGVLTLSGTGVQLNSTSTGAWKLPVGTTAQRPTGASGLIRMNSTTSNPEWYDTTTSSWLQFSQPAGYSVNYLVVAGGGGGGDVIAGGGGAGGLLSGTISLSSGTAYTITIGSGGAGSASTTSPGTNGTNTSFSTFAIPVGGGGGGSSATAAVAGGSGGGGSYLVTAGAVGTSGQGFAGGTGFATGNQGGGGGGGSSIVGVNATTNGGGAGGAGTVSTISGSSVTYAGGGGGGTGSGAGGAGGAGGGGAGGPNNTAGVAGSANTGGGGGGGGVGGNGGSGVVIIAYLGSQRGTGGTVTSSGGYTIHTFTSSGTYNA